MKKRERGIGKRLHTYDREKSTYNSNISNQYITKS